MRHPFKDPIFQKCNTILHRHLYIEKVSTVSVRLGTKPYIKFIKCINSNALDKLSKIMYSTLLNKGDASDIHLLIQTLCLYTQHKSDIRKGDYCQFTKLEEDVI